MLTITHRSIVFSAAALFTVLTSAAAAQNPEPASQSNITAADNDDAELMLAEPDFRVLNLPSTLRLPLHGSNFQLTHRFNGNLRQGSINGNASNLFGLDQGAAVGFEYRASGYRPDKAAYGFAIEKRAGGHLFQLNVNNGQGTTFGQLARGGFSDSLYLLFNLARKFF